MAEDIKHTHNRQNEALGAPINRVISFTPEQFDKLFLAAGPRQPGIGLGNPTPLGVISFTMTATPASWVLMGWRGSNPGALVALTGVAYFYAGLGLSVAAIFELILGNTFPAVVFSTFSAFWLSFAVLLDPMHGLNESVAASANATAAFTSAVGLYLTAWTVLSLIYTFLALRTNLVFVWILGWLTICFALLSAAYFTTAEGLVASSNLYISGGALLFVCALGGWYLFFVQMIDILGFNFTLPVGDMSHFMAKRSK